MKFVTYADMKRNQLFTFIWLQSSLTINSFANVLDLEFNILYVLVKAL